MKKLKKIFWTVTVLLSVLLIAYLYSVFFRPTYHAPQTNIGVLGVGLLLGGFTTLLLIRAFSKNKPKDDSNDSSHTVLESIEKVFKIVSTEGYFQEIYNYEQTKKLFKIIPSTKRALVVVKAKVLIGYDMKKSKWEFDNKTQQINIVEFPQPEMLSIEPEYKYYHIEEDLFNVINREDLHKIQVEAKKQIVRAVEKSELKQIANDQMKLLLTEMLNASQWTITNPEKIKLSTDQPTNNDKTLHQ